MLDFCVSNNPVVSPSPNNKERGAYYTSYILARCLSEWALRSSADRMLDPSFGGGIFLQTGFERLTALGNKEAEDALFGVELDSETHGNTLSFLKARQSIQESQLIQSNFFKVSPSNLKQVSVVLGNPPFIRFQAQNKDEKETALALCQAAGVSLTKQTNLWVPFIIHSCSFLEQGGRLAFVVPQDIAHASYAKPLLEFLALTFKKTTFVTFENTIFKDINQDVVLLLAEGKGESGNFYLKDLANHHLLTGNLDLDQAEAITPQMFISKSSFSYYWLSSNSRSVLSELERSAQTTRLGSIAQVNNGYVTGANHYFHLNLEQKKQHNLYQQHLKKTVFRTASLQGLQFTPKDWQQAEKNKQAGFVLALPKANIRSQKARAYLENGIKEKIHLNYKCRNREPWHRVPNIAVPDAFLSYMSGPQLHLVSNNAKVSAPNSLHHLSMKNNTPITLKQLCIVWPNTLTQLSAELTGRSLGGGMLKLEPSEAQKVLLPLSSLAHEYFAQIDQLLRQKEQDAAQNLADSSLEGLLSKEDLATLKTDLATLKRRRRKLKN